MLPHHKRHGELTAEITAELGWSCIRKKGFLKSRGWLRPGCGGKKNLPPAPASPWSQSSSRAGVRDPATQQQPLAASPPLLLISLHPGTPQAPKRYGRKMTHFIALPPHDSSSCLLPKHLPTL